MTFTIAINAVRRGITVLTVAGTTAWPLLCQAIGLGPITGSPIIGEPLRLEIPLTGAVEPQLDSGCASVRRVRDAIDADYFPRDLVARIDRQATPRVVLESRSALRQPLVEFQVLVGCGFNLSHDYLLLAGPRKEPAPAAVPATSPAAGAARPAMATTTANSVVAAPAVVANPSLPDGIAGKNVVLDREMTLEQLARRHFPGPLRQQRFMRWVVEANPQYFVGAGKLSQHRLPSGATLVVPDGVPPRRPGDHQGNVTPLGEKIAAPVAENPDRAPRTQATATLPADRDGTRANTGKDRLVVGSGASARNMKEALALIEQLTGMMEKQVEAQTTYNEKIQQLEATVDELGKQLKTLDAEGKQREARWQAERQAEKAAREQEAEREWWKLLAAVIGGGLLGGGILVALKALSSRKEEPVDDLVLAQPIDEPVSTAEIKTAATPPLTEFGWDNDSGHEPPAATPPASVQAAAPHIDFELPFNQPAAEEHVDDPAGAAIELANIMTQMGLTQSAAQTLVEHIRENPRESLPQWLKLLEIHRLAGNRSEFERSASELRQHFNVQPDDWMSGPVTSRNSLESYPHIRAQVVRLWRQPECATLLRSLLLDNREGTRAGFPATVAEEILLLIAILNGNK